MAKNTKKRAVIYSNVKENKKRAEEKSKNKDDQINLNDEVIIGMKNFPNENKATQKKSTNKKKKYSKGKNKNVKRTSNNRNNLQKSNKKIKKKRAVVNPEKRKKALFVVKVIGIVLVLIIGIIIFLKSSLFNIKEVSVIINNNKYVTGASIEELSGVQIGQNLYSINKKKIMNAIKSNTYIESVKIKKSLPDKLIIEVDERAIKFQLKNEGGYTYIDNHGIAIENGSDSKDVITVTGYHTENIEFGSKLNKDDLKGLSDVLQILQEAQNNDIASSISSIDISDLDEYVIYFNDLGKVVHLGDTNSINSKMSYIKLIMEREKDYEGEIFVNVDLNNGGQPFFREKV